MISPQPIPLSYRVPARRKRLYQNLTVQVLVAVAVGAAIGTIWGRPGAQACKPLMDGFIKLVKMVVSPIVFLTIVSGIAGMGNLRKLGRIGGKALLYFEVVTTLALAIGLVVANVAKPGHGVDTSQASAATQSAEDKAKIAEYEAKAKKQSTVEFVMGAIPDSFVGAFAREDAILQVLVLAVLTGVAVAGLGERAAPVLAGVDRATEVMFRVVALVMRLAPVGALGAMAFTVGWYGLGTLRPLLYLMGCVYLTMILFIFVGLGVICRAFGFSVWQYLKFIRQEIVLVLGTSSSESALPRMIEKLELMGCGREVVKMVIPAGYSFNLDGTSIYLSMAVLFIAQAFGVDMSIGQQLYVMGILMLTSKGAAAVTGGGFITLAATLSATHALPVEGLGLLFGVDRFMSEARAITNLIGNGVATICVSKWEGAFDEERYRAAVSGVPVAALVGAGGVAPEVAADLGRGAG